MSTRYRATVEYDGAAYFGFQRQVASQPTIQGELEAALQRVADRPVTVIGAGRTDSGVHASGQVVGFDLAWSHGPAALQRALNANLPDDIVVRQAAVARPDFHPRFDARRRSYEYLVYNQPLRSPLHRLRSWHVARPLDMGAMNRAAKALAGRQDFATFGQAPQGDNTVREVFRAEWQERGVFLAFTIEANAFLYRMVRSLVGTMKAVGEGAWTVDEFVAALRAGERGRAGQTAPPQGLCLTAVIYDETNN